MSAPEPSANTFRWRRPQEVMKLQKLKRKKKILQARINASATHPAIPSQNHPSIFENFINTTKRTNPFLTCNIRDNKRTCRDMTNCHESRDKTNCHERRDEMNSHERRDMTNCHESRDETNSYDCRDKTNTHECRDKTNGHDCLNKTNCHECRDKTNCHECRDEMNSHESRDKTNSDECRDKTNCHECRDKTNSHECRDNTNSHECRDKTNCHECRDKTNCNECRDKTNSHECRDETNIDDSESGDSTLLKQFDLTDVKTNDHSNELNANIHEPIEHVLKVVGERWTPVDWTLKSKIRFLSEKPFGWSQKLKISEEASGVTSFSRCLDLDNEASAMDTSPNARFHQCCLVWQQPHLPWLPLFPRSNNRGRSSTPGCNSIGASGAAADALHSAFCDGLRSLHQLIRTRHCAYFYACADSFTVLFRAAGVAGFPDTHALITPTTRGLRHMLKLADVEFTMPLMVKGATAPKDEGEVNKNSDDDTDDHWMESMGINKDDIKRINYTQARITQACESMIDHSDQSLVFVEGVEVQALYNFLINSCKSTVSSIGALVGVPPTLLAPVAFTGATLTPLQVREGKVHVGDDSYYSVDITGPVLPSTVHNLLSIAPRAHTFTATFSNVPSTVPFGQLTWAAVRERSGVVQRNEGAAAEVFREKNLSDCGLAEGIVKRFCSDNGGHVAPVDCLKYTVESKSYAWS